MKESEIKTKKDYIEKVLGPSIDYKRVFSTLAFAGVYKLEDDPKRSYIDLLLYMVNNDLKSKVPFYSDFKLPWNDKPFFDQLKKYKYIIPAGGGFKEPVKVKKRPARRIDEPKSTNTIIVKKKQTIKSKPDTIKNLEKVSNKAVAPKTIMDEIDESVPGKSDLDITIRTLKNLGLEDTLDTILTSLLCRKEEIVKEIEMIDNCIKNHFKE